MIPQPKRSVTRFFIPLIDVLILLFCIFLLMPFVSKPDDGKGVDPPPALDPSLPTDVEKLQQDLSAAKRRIEDLKVMRGTLAEQTSVKVLEIDPADGTLFFFDADADPAARRQKLATQADAQRLINRHKARAAGKDVLFVILHPRVLTGFPLKDQLTAYRTWFADVPARFDNPFAAGSP